MNGGDRGTGTATAGDRRKFRELARAAVRSRRGVAVAGVCLFR
jgi:hypothetical protein